ncbi:MAG: hypothetical protein M3R68_11085 [Acidobacteriota bacterium]|nr:hypothetical protein [Acidobacteriota bacterium]
MFHARYLKRSSCLMAVALVFALFSSPAVTVAQRPARSPSDTVREFYKAMREKRFREAFALSIYKPAIDGLSEQEFEELRPDFNNMALAIPDKVEINGEQISADIATVFVKVTSLEDPVGKPEPVTLILVGGEWIIGTREDLEVVKKAGNKFFLNARIDTHHGEVTSMMSRITVAELIYSQAHNGAFGDLAALITAGLIPKDIEGTESTGYRFRLTLGKDAKTYTVNAEPAQYGRTGRLSYFMDSNGMRSGDNAGKPLSVKSEPN